MLSSQTIFLSFLFSMHMGIAASQRVYNYFAAIQLTNEIYSSYLPMIQDCSYNNSKIINGKVILEPLYAQDFFDFIIKQNNAVFWIPIKDGTAISSLLPENLPAQYDGYVEYNSKIIGNKRSIILYQFTPQSIKFVYVVPELIMPDLTINFTKISSQTIQLTNQTSALIENCFNDSQNSSNSQIEYLGNNQFIYFCKQNSESFVFSVGNLVRVGTPFNLEANLATKIINITSNPSNLIAENVHDYVESSQFWNLQILAQSQNSFFLSFCNIASMGNNYTCINHTQLIDEVVVIINRVWGQELFGQHSKWLGLLYIIQTLKISVDIPGTINQIFISETSYVYIESYYQNKSYLNIFYEDGSLIANVYYEGVIVYYGPAVYLIYNKASHQFFKLEIRRPILFIENANGTRQQDQYTNQQAQIQCSNNSTIMFNYTILWTSQRYPSGIVYLKNYTQSFESQSQIFSLNIDELFTVIGPAYSIYVNTSEQLQATQIDSSVFQLKMEFQLVLGIQYISNRFLRVYFATASEILMVSVESLESIIVHRLPCGFTQIVQTEKIKDGVYLVFNPQNRACLCIKNFTSCFLTNSQNSISSVLMNPQNKYKTGSYYSQTYLQPQIQKNSKIQSRKNLYELYSMGLLISILSNNTVFLIDTNSKQILSSYDMPCKKQNTTEGSIYLRQFYDPFLMLFCYNGLQVTQLIIRNFTLYFQRVIPLYGFKIRQNSNPMLIGYNYAFLEVDKLSQRIPKLDECCVLRFDPCQYTVSFIQQIIYSKTLLFVNQIKTFDVAIFNNSETSSSNSYIKIYYGNAELVLNYTNRTNSVSYNQIQIIFQSFSYNFASIYSLEVNFNLTGFELIVGDLLLPPIALKAEQSSIDNKTYFMSNFSINFTKICGPIFSSFIFQKNKTLNNFQIYQEDVIVPTKVLGQIGVNFMQIVVPHNYDLPIPGSALNGLIFLISTDTLYVYQMQLNDVFMQEIYVIPLKQQECLYYIYQQIDLNTLTLLGNCEIPDYDQLSPLLTISYNNYTIEYSEGTMMFPMQLYKLYSLLRPYSPPLIAGIEQGPIKTKTGSLFICLEGICSLLYISTKYQFLLDYDIYGLYDNFLLLSLDAQKICAFITPYPSSSTQIYPDFTISYTNYTENDLCSIINLYYYSDSIANFMLSCTNYYYQFSLNVLDLSLQVMAKYIRLPACSIGDTFRSDILHENGNVGMFFAVCDQNQATIQFQEFQTINSSLPVIYTGFLQIFAPPSGPQCNGSFNPIRVIPLSTSLDYPVFASYKLGSQFKFIYSQINGRLYDNNVVQAPKIQLTFAPLSPNYELPELQIFIQNPYQIKNATFLATIEQSRSISVFVEILFSLFCLFSLINALFILCAIVSQFRRKKSGINQFRDSFSRRGTGFGFDADNFQKQIQERFNNLTIQNKSQTGKAKGGRKYTQIQLFYIKNSSA